MAKTYYVTTPIYYVNDKPHIGHAYTSLAADIIARFKRLDGYDVYFLTGTDEHGQKVQKSAMDKGKNPKEFTDEVSQHFIEMGKLLNLTNTNFIRTTNEDHKLVVQHVWTELQKKDFIYKDTYKGWYAIRDEAYYTDDELIENPKGVKVAPSGAEVVWKEEDSYFFKLSLLQDKLLEYYLNNPNTIRPKSRYNEVVSFIKSGLKDLSISRSSFSWGVKVPGEEQDVIYVWLDALTNYISALNYSKADSTLYKKFWPANLHLIGKDIVRFHAVYWVAFLMALELELPKKIFAHGWWLNNGQKISKSLGNVINVTDLVSTYGLDSIRYFLFKEVSFGNDGDFNHQAISVRVNNELANEYGNLLQRCLSLHAKYFNLKVNNINYTADQQEYMVNFKKTVDAARNFIDEQDFLSYIENAWQIIKYANAYINNTAPWMLIKEGQMSEAELHLNYILELTKRVSILLWPIVPNACTNALNQLNISDMSLENINEYFKHNHQFNTPSIIFNKIDT